ncbi:MAG TPA: ADP-ribosylglycohydrolase family protein [Roseateles sp.]
MQGAAPQADAPPTLDQFQGCLLGLALGDALGAPREGGPVERLLWALIGKTTSGEMRWTDDTQMSIDVAESLLGRPTIDEDDLAQRFARSYRWSRGYGPGAARVLKRIAKGADWRQASRSVYPEGSFGNGGAMRAPVIALFFAQTPLALADAARRIAAITHAHPLGVEGAELVALATKQALRRSTGLELVTLCAAATTQQVMASRAAVAREWLHAGASPSPREVAQQLGRGIAAADSCITAIYLAARFLEAPFEDLIRFVACVGGDVDTIGAMAGGIWGASRGRVDLPPAALDKLESRDRLTALATALHAAVAHGSDLRRSP